MSKDTNKHPIPYAFSPFAMGMPFPMFQQPMGQFIPMGMLPMNGSTTPSYMPDIAKNGYGPPPMEVFPQCPHIKRTESSSSVTTMNKERLKSNDERKHSPDSSSNIEEKQYNSPYETPYIGAMGGTMLPMMPSVMFFPYLGGFPGLFPPGLQQLTPHEINKLPTTSITDEDDDKQNENENIESEKPVEAGSDELDVAQILVDMQGSSKQRTDFLPPSGRSSSVIQEEGADCTDGHNENVDVTALEPSKVLQKGQSTERIDNKSIDYSINETTSEQSSRKAILTNNANVAVPFEMKAEYLPCNSDQEKVNKHANFEAVPKIQIKTEKDECDEAEANSISTLNTNDVQIEKNSTLRDNIRTDFQPNQAIQLHELQVPKRQDLEQQQHQASFTDEQVQQHSEMIYSNNMEVSSEVSVPSNALIDVGYCHEVNEQIKQNHASEEKPAAVEQGSLEEEQLNDSTSNLKMTFKCDVCSQLFRSPLGLQKHIEFHTDDGKHYTCSICFVPFHNNANLQSHLETHTKKRPHKCTFCPKAFRDPGSLQKHVRVHTGEKPFDCKDCDRSFAEYSSLRKHQRVHTGEQPYKCQFCNKAFSISGNLQRHILIHTGERPYKCNFCPKAFNNPSHLRRHVKNLHFKGDSVVDEAMLSHYGNHINKAGDEPTDEVAMDVTAEAMIA